MTQFAVGDRVHHIRITPEEVGVVTDCVTYSGEPHVVIQWPRGTTTADTEDSIILVNPIQSLVSDYAQYYEAITENT